MESQHITGETENAMTQKECGNLKIGLAPSKQLKLMTERWMGNIK